MTPEELELLGITPEAILYVLTWGMGVVLTFYGLGIATGSAIKGIKRA